ncbi:MAG: hypothetical protein GY821_14930, partial [Gammaproteobacteria bacterium]|nr:hypothetical protein [Gammaproteobacteria bacterium]
MIHCHENGDLDNRTTSLMTRDAVYQDGLSNGAASFYDQTELSPTHSIGAGYKRVQLSFRVIV